MIDQDKFEFIKKKYGHCASWAIWANEGLKPKENIHDLSMFNIECDTCILSMLNPNIVLVGLNISRSIIEKESFANFHDSNPHAMDYKIRYALRNSPYWGAYMTDIIKDREQKNSGKIMSYLSVNKTFEEENIKIFRDELQDIGSRNPELVAFGKDTYTILTRHFKNEFKILKLPHYSNYTAKEKYRDEVKNILKF